MWLADMLYVLLVVVSSTNAVHQMKHIIDWQMQQFDDLDFAANDQLDTMHQVKRMLPVAMHDAEHVIELDAASDSDHDVMPNVETQFDARLDAKHSLLSKHKAEPVADDSAESDAEPAQSNISTDKVEPVMTLKGNCNV